KNFFYSNVRQVGKQGKVGILSGSYTAQFMVTAEITCCIDCRHLYGTERVHAFLDSTPDNMVKMPPLQNCFRMGIVRTKDGICTVNTLLSEGTDCCFDIVPGGTLPQHCIHAVAQF